MLVSTCKLRDPACIAVLCQCWSDKCCLQVRLYNHALPLLFPPFPCSHLQSARHVEAALRQLERAAEGLAAERRREEPGAFNANAACGVCPACRQVGV